MDDAKKPLKRVRELQSLSHDHHHGLQLCWKIRTGISKQIAPHRIKAYSDWFYKNHLAPHFKIEERDVFTVLGSDNELVKRAIAEHKDLTLLFTTEKDVKENLEKIESELKAHIRFEERELFTEIQNRATSEQLKIINDAHSENSFIENTTDEFWL